MSEAARVAGAAARVFIQQPDRIAAAWRRVRFSQVAKGHYRANVLDDVVEGFVCEVGKTLAGQPGDPWARTRGILRLGLRGSVRGLHEEFDVLRHCMTDALEALHATDRERHIAQAALDDALDSAVALCQCLADPSAEPPTVPFGGVVLEVFERRQPEAREHMGTAAQLN